MKKDCSDYLLEVFVGFMILAFAGLAICGGYSAYNYYSMLGECRAKGHTRLYCYRAIDGKSVRLEGSNLDE